MKIYLGEKRKPTNTKIKVKKELSSTQRSQDYSTKSKTKSIQEEYRPKRTRVISRKKVKRKLLGIPVNVLLFVLVLGVVLGASAYVKTLRATVTVEAYDYSAFNTVDWDNNEGFNVAGGDTIKKKFEILNNAGDFSMNGEVKLIFDGPISDNECKMFILDSDNNVLKEKEVSPFEITHKFNNIGAGQKKTGYWKLQCNPDFNESIAVKLELTQSSNFEFD